MQYDMHYYGTYTMAAAAGIPKEDAEAIAMAAQYVDDQNFQDMIVAGTGEGILGIATAHHPFEAGVRVADTPGNNDDSRLVWVPFHFLPGNIGKTFRERLVTQKDSAVANAMLDHYLKAEIVSGHRRHALQLIGIAAHVYADTFSHYGFSGISCDINAVKTDTLEVDETHSKGILDYLSKKKDRFQSLFGGAPKLGHGAALTYPDRPYLRWSFEYEDGRGVSKRDNTATFLEACQALHQRFIQFSSVYYGDACAKPILWNNLMPIVKSIIEREGSADERVEFWLNTIEEGLLSDVQVPKRYNPETWHAQLNALHDADNDHVILESEPYLFFTAADYHRSFVLKRLLPDMGLMVA